MCIYIRAARKVSFRQGVDLQWIDEFPQLCSTLPETENACPFVTDVPFQSV